MGVDRQGRRYPRKKRDSGDIGQRFLPLEHDVDYKAGEWRSFGLFPSLVEGMYVQ